MYELLLNADFGAEFFGYQWNANESITYTVVQKKKKVEVECNI
jgi:hypothetical protein